MLNFVKIEVKGFKSFADKVEIPFKEGVTAIIGPNGCGKSNVSDAIRWTLGESSAKQLRGKSMQDVIFAGTEKRKSLSYCEVSLTFNNENGRLFPALSFDEVVFTRKLDRSGISEYYINGSRCKREEIYNLIRDTGIGKEGYSIIGQGKVEEIMSAKPDARRHIFEEAAGITKHRVERDMAERKLESAKLNLQTTNEVIAEIEKQIGPLRKQAEAAQKYDELTEKLKYNEVNCFLCNYESLGDRKKEIQTKIDACIVALREKRAEVAECERRYAEYSAMQNELDGLLNDRNAELTALKVSAARFQGEADVLKVRIAGMQQEIDRLQKELNSAANDLITQEQLISDKENRRDEEQRALLRASNECAVAETKLRNLKNELNDASSLLDERHEEYLKSIQQLGELKADIARLQAEKAANERRAKDVLELLSQKKAKLDEEQTNLAVYSGSAAAARESIRQLSEKYNETLSEKHEAQEAIKEFNANIKALETKRVNAEGDLKLALRIIDNYEGFQPSVQKLLRDADENGELSLRIWGVLANVISVPSEYETAIEYALGGAMQNILVDSESDARFLINYLKAKNHGRVTFRPNATCRPQSLSGESRNVLRDRGCCGIASGLISYDSKFDRIIASLLGSTVIVRTIDDAIRLFRQYNQAFKIVTLDGEVFSRGGEITGGSRRTANNLLSQERRVEEARAAVDKYVKSINVTERLIAEKEAEIVAYTDLMDGISKDMSELRIRISVEDERSKNTSASIDVLNAEVSRDAAEYEAVKGHISELSNKLSSIDSLERYVSEKKTMLDEMTISKTEKNRQESERDKLSEEYNMLFSKVTEHSTALKSHDQELYRLRQELREMQSYKQDLILQLETEKNKLEIITRAPEKQVFSKKEEQRIAQLEDEIKGFIERKRTIGEDLAALNKKKTELYNDCTVFVEERTHQEEKLSTAEINMVNEQERILNTYNLTYTDALVFKDPEFKLYGAKTEIDELRRARNRLGEVNHLAKQSLRETEERLQVQISYRDDITKSCDDIYLVIDRLTERMKGTFTDAFTKISENFKEVFAQLFGGGKGELRLNTSETDDVLEAGIEIYAQPPGKKLQNIGLLSGGERALTAIAILFAILRLKPMPFCVLDEIEAALDDANVNLFAEFLKKFSDFTQFIVITHRKPTMRHADTIFGVTMEEKGVTKIVSIEFEEAVKHAK